MQQKITFKSYMIYGVILLLVAYVLVAIVITFIFPLMIPHLYGANLNLSQIVIQYKTYLYYVPNCAWESLMGIRSLEWQDCFSLLCL